jgi:hypothetical protein
MWSKYLQGPFVYVFKFVWLSYKCSVSVNDLKQRITAAAASVDEHTLRYVWKELHYLTNICSMIKTHT